MASKPHAFMSNAQTLVREGEEVHLSRFVAFSIIPSWLFASDGDFIDFLFKPHAFRLET